MLDLGCGDGRLLRLALGARPAIVEAIGVDRSPPMLARARATFEADARVSILEHDLCDQLGALGSFDAIVSGFAPGLRRCSNPKAMLVAMRVFFQPMVSRSTENM